MPPSVPAMRFASDFGAAAAAARGTNAIAGAIKSLHISNVRRARGAAPAQRARSE